MISGRSRLTTYEKTENLNPGKTSSVTAAPPTRGRRSSTTVFHPARARRAAVGEEEPLERHPIHLEPDEIPRRAVLPLGRERAAPVERTLVGAHGPSEVDLVGRGLPRLDKRVMRGEVIDVHHDEPGLDPGDVEGPDARRRHAVWLPRLHDRVPERDRLLGRLPDLVPEIAGVSRARNR